MKLAKGGQRGAEHARVVAQDCYPRLAAVPAQVPRGRQVPLADGAPRFADQVSVPSATVPATARPTAPTSYCGFAWRRLAAASAAARLRAAGSVGSRWRVAAVMVPSALTMAARTCVAPRSIPMVVPPGRLADGVMMSAMLAGSDQDGRGMAGWARCGVAPVVVPGDSQPPHSLFKDLGRPDVGEADVII
jgi:hypothetical protein